MDAQVWRDHGGARAADRGRGVAMGDAVTALRDDGYLETDDPVVAACFLGQEVCARFLEIDDPMDDPWQTDILSIISNYDVTGRDLEDYRYPIRIPAATVAEVWDHGMGGVPAMVIAWSMNKAEKATTIDEWLRQHTEAAEK